MITCIIAGRRTGKTMLLANWLLQVQKGLMICPTSAGCRIGEQYGVETISANSMTSLRGRSFERIAIDEPFYITMVMDGSTLIDTVAPHIIPPIDANILLAGTPSVARGIPDWITSRCKIERPIVNGWHMDHDELLEKYGSSTIERRLCFEF